MSVTSPTEDPTLSLARALLQRPSLTPEDAGCLDLLGERLAALGFRLERMDADGVSNLWARRGDAAPVVCFAGHTDVVPTGPLDAWRHPPFAATLADGQLWGRGAADMKSSLAAFVTAIEDFLAEHPEPAGSIALLLTSDEEGPATHGSVEVVRRLAARGERLDYCIIGEPTASHTLGDTIKNGRRGSLSGKLRVRGIQGHVAYPQLARNPIHQLAPALAELTATEWDTGNAHFPPTSFQVSNLHAGTGATNVIPGECVVDFNFRFSTASSAEGLQSRVCAILDAQGLDYELTWAPVGKPFLTASGRLVEALRGAIRAELGIETQLSTSGGTSDGRFIADICAELVECGPVNASIHKIDEHIASAALAPLSAIYRRTLAALLTAS